MAEDISRPRTRVRIVIALVLVLPAMMTACGDASPDVESATRPGTEQSSEPETYAVTGRIMTVTPDRDFLMVRHDAIEGFMEAMTMPFAVRDTALVSGISAGDSVSFVIDVARGEATITSIEKR